MEKMFMLLARLVRLSAVSFLCVSAVLVAQQTYTPGQLDPTRNIASAQLNLGVLCMQTGDYPCARTAFQSFLADAPPAAFRDSIPRVKYALSTVLAQRQ